MPRQPWQLLSSHGHHGAPLLAPPHTTISQHTGWPLCASASGVGHHGSRCQPFRSGRVDGHCGVVVSFVLRRNMWGNVPGNWQCLPDKVTMSIPSGIGAIGLAASTPNWLLCCILWEGTLWGNDVWQRWGQNRRKKSGRRQFQQQVSLHIDQSWRSPLSYGHHEAPLPAFRHTTISKHTMWQDYIVKTREKYH
jgi:hypothetical protein